MAAGMRRRRPTNATVTDLIASCGIDMPWPSAPWLIDPRGQAVGRHVLRHQDHAIAKPSKVDRKRQRLTNVDRLRPRSEDVMPAFIASAGHRDPYNAK
ncbi:hypothetical protein ONO86_06555 [Micromonospora noduli]|nr:hypothetical protein LUPAC07_04270 [Micromonospora noduli]RAO25376.1 hypothetical protein ONO86_06555 [Micromonospora noduli]